MRSYHTNLEMTANLWYNGQPLKLSNILNLLCSTSFSNINSMVMPTQVTLQNKCQNKQNNSMWLLRSHFRKYENPSWISSPSELWMDVLIRFKSIFHVSVKSTGKWQDSVKVINEALSSTWNMKQDNMVILEVKVVGVTLWWWILGLCDI